MNRSAIAGAVAAAGLAFGMLGAPDASAETELWYMSRYGLRTEKDVTIFSNVVVRLTKSGYKAVTLNVFNGCERWNDAWRANFLKAKACCDAYGLEIIPSVWSLGYGDMLSGAPDMVEGYELRDVPYRVAGGKAMFAGGDAEYAPAKLEDIGLARLYAKVRLPSRRRMRVTGEFRPEGEKVGKSFRFSIRGKGEEDWFCMKNFPCKAGQDWTPFSVDFTVRDVGDCEIYSGFWLKGGKVSVRGLSIRELAPALVIASEGAPCRVSDAKTGAAYEMGRDYADFRGIRRPVWDWTTAQDKPAEIPVLPGGRIADGAELKVSLYVPAETHGDQVSVCPLHPQLRARTEANAKAIEELVHPKRWFLAINEYRNGGQCALCKASGKPFGQLLGECVRMQRDVIRAINPQAEMFIWSDMFDPTMNACDGFYNCASTVKGSWEHVPKDVGMCIWDDVPQKAERAAGFFMGHGFPIMLASYYDKDEKDPEMKYTREQVAGLRRFTDRPIVMYASWKCGNSKIEAFAAAAQGALDELMPKPKKVELGEGTVPAAFAKSAKVVTAPVADAPAATADEAYVLEIRADGIVITAPTRRGEIWARGTLGQLAKLAGSRLPCCRITDWPRFKWRGFMPDTGRNFMAVEDVKAVIDAMSRNKMNLLHWHLTEYYGWRLESKRYPELQKDASFYLRHVGKYYTQEEFKTLVDYAWARGVTIMPEFDIPGHALAFRRAFGFETMRDEGVREKLCDLVDELCALVPAEKMPFIHLGTDEARLPEEKVPPLWLEPMVRRAYAAGRTVVGWTPGELKGLEGSGPIVGMRWGRPKGAGVGKMPFFDACSMYLDTLDPFEITTVATYRKICQWDESEGERLGGVVCAWHDDFVRNGYEFIRNQAVMPALTLFGDALWDGREDGEETVGRWMPRAGNKALARAAAVERRTQAQRDRIWCDSPYPYQFLKQTDMRWRVTDGRTGEVLATNVAQATVFMWQACGDGVEGGKVVSSAGNIFTNRSGVAVMETWIRSPKDQEVGAWIGFTDFTRDHGRAYSAPTPDVGKWNRNDATVELNGERVAPPKWRKPGQLAGGDVPYLLYVHELDEKPFEDEEYYMREPTRIMLKKGWNHVKLTIPCKRAANHAPWVGTFIPLLGTTEHPREVPGLEYSCMPK